MLAALAGFASGCVAPREAQTATADARAGGACIVAPAPDSLWSLAQCCARSLASDPECRGYSKTGGFIILKDHSPAKPDAYLIIPTTKVTGVEDPGIFEPPVADFWAYAWRQAQIYLKRPAADTGLAINSAFGRTQNQLHIHISCLRRDVSKALAANEAEIGADPVRPFEMRLPPHNHLYRVIKVTSLSTESPFVRVAAMPGAAKNMAGQGIAVAQSRMASSYFVLDTRHGSANPGAAEELLDQSCLNSIGGYNIQHIAAVGNPAAAVTLAPPAPYRSRNQERTRTAIPTVDRTAAMAWPSSQRKRQVRQSAGSVTVVHLAMPALSGALKKKNTAIMPA
jgi:CDP-diacylglycerol pyrophosphatase